MRYGIRPSRLLEWLALYAKKIPVPVLDVIVGPLQARALVAAGQVGLLNAIAEGEASCDQLAARLGLDADCLLLVLRVLRAMGYVEQRAQRWKLSALGECHFGLRAREPYRAFVAYGGPQWRLIEALDQVLRTGQGLDFHTAQSDQDWHAYQLAMFENASAFSWFVVDNVPVPRGAQSCLDLAGSHGWVSAALCRRHPGLRSTVFDLPSALAVARPLAERQGYAEHVTFQEGDLLKDAYGVDHDVVLLCNILHHFPVETNLEILGKVYAALRPGGVVAIFDLETPAPDAPAEAAADAFALYFRITSSSSCFRGADYERWLGACGFRRVRTVRSLRMPSRMLALGER